MWFILLLALASALAVYLLLWRTRAGYALRAVGSSPSAAAYAGISGAFAGNLLPGQFDALHLLGVIAARTGNPAEAEKLISQALAIKPAEAAAALAQFEAAVAVSTEVDPAQKYRPGLLGALRRGVVARRDEAAGSCPQQKATPPAHPGAAQSGV